MKIEIAVDTNDYDEEDDLENCQATLRDPNENSEWSLFRLKLATFQDWEVAGQTGFWTVDGETFCGTRYSCEVNYRDDLLLRCLVNAIKKSVGDRLQSISIDDEVVKFTDDDLMEMPPVLVKKMKSS